MCMKNEVHETKIILCRYPSPTTGKMFSCYVYGYTQAFKLMRQLLKAGAINDSIDFSFMPVNVVVGGDSDE